MGKQKRFFLLSSFAVMLVLQTRVGLAGMVNDLTNEWSNASNGTGDNLWSYRNGTTVLASDSNWTPLMSTFVQPAWAPGNDTGTFLSAWFQATQADLGWQAGDIIVHTTDVWNGVGAGPANVIWTSTGSSIVNISGSLFEGRAADRAQKWSILLNNTVLSSGKFLTDGTYTRDQPMVFNSTSLDQVAVKLGDTIQLRFDVMPLGDFIGVNLRITEETEVPEPSTMPLAAISLAFVMYRLRRGRA